MLSEFWIYSEGLNTCVYFIMADVDWIVFPLKIHTLKP